MFASRTCNSEWCFSSQWNLSFVYLQPIAHTHIIWWRSVPSWKKSLSPIFILLFCNTIIHSKMKICCRQTSVERGLGEGGGNAKYRRQQGVLSGAEGNTAWPDVATTERKAKYVILCEKHNSAVRAQHKNSGPPASRVTAVVMIAFKIVPQFSAQQWQSQHLWPIWRHLYDVTNFACPRTVCTTSEFCLWSSFLVLESLLNSDCRHDNVMFPAQNHTHSLPSVGSSSPYLACTVRGFCWRASKFVMLLNNDSS
jgi:hypothetical protein